MIDIKSTAMSTVLGPTVPYQGNHPATVGPSLYRFYGTIVLVSQLETKYTIIVFSVF